MIEIVAECLSKNDILKTEGCMRTQVDTNPQQVHYLIDSNLYIILSGVLLLS